MEFTSSYGERTDEAAFGLSGAFAHVAVPEATITPKLHAGTVDSADVPSGVVSRNGSAVLQFGPFERRPRPRDSRARARGSPTLLVIFAAASACAFRRPGAVR